MDIQTNLDDAFTRCTKVAGSMSIALVRRSFRPALALYWIGQLRQAADILEGVVKAHSKERTSND